MSTEFPLLFIVVVFIQIHLICKLRSLNRIGSIKLHARWRPWKVSVPKSVLNAINSISSPNYNKINTKRVILMKNVIKICNIRFLLMKLRICTFQTLKYLLRCAVHWLFLPHFFRVFLCVCVLNMNCVVGVSSQTHWNSVQEKRWVGLCSLQQRNLNV